MDGLCFVDGFARSASGVDSTGLVIWNRNA